MQKVRQRRYGKSEAEDDARARGITLPTGVSGAWSAAEDDIVASLYATKSASYIGAVLGRSYRSVETRAQRLGLRKRDKSRTWTDADDKQLLVEYLACNQKGENVAAISQRTPRAVYGRASKLGLTKRRVRPWTAEEEKIVQDNYRALGAKWCAYKTRRSVAAVQQRATRLFLRHYKRWSKKDDAVLWEHYEARGALWCAKKLGRTSGTVRFRAQYIGVNGKRGRPNKHSYAAVNMLVETRRRIRA